MGKPQEVKLEEGDKAYIMKKENGKLTFWEILVWGTLWWANLWADYFYFFVSYPKLKVKIRCV